VAHACNPSYLEGRDQEDCGLKSAWENVRGPEFKPQHCHKKKGQPMFVGIDNPLVPKTDTQETENLDKPISLNQEGASICLCPLPLSHTQAQNG
jgi:hypothetical protein